MSTEHTNLGVSPLNTISLHTLTSPCGAQYVLLGDDVSDLEACMAPGDILVTEELQSDDSCL